MEEDEDILIERDFRFDPPFFYEKGKPFFPIVCRNPDRVSEGFNATTLYLDGRLSSTLDWKIQKQAAAKAIAARRRCVVFARNRRADDTALRDPVG